MFSSLIPLRRSALSFAAWEMRPFKLHDFCLCLFCLCLWSVCCLLFVWMATAGLWAPRGRGNSSILKRNSLVGCADLGLTGADFEEAEWFFWREETVADLELPAPLCSTFPAQLLLVSPHFSDIACFVLFHKAAALQVKKSRSNTNGDKSKHNWNEACWM